MTSASRCTSPAWPWWCWPLFFAPKQPVPFLFQAVNSNGRSLYWWAFVLGLLQAQWTYTGFDASAHMAEETHDPRRRAPWGIVLSVAVSGVAGYFLLLALTLAIQSIPGVLAAKDAQGNQISAVIAILQQALGAKAGNAMAALVSHGDVVLRSRLHHLGFTLAVFAGARPRYAFFGTGALGQPAARHAGAIHLADRGRVHGRDAVDQGGADRDVAEHRGAVSGLHHSDRAGLAGAPCRFGLADPRGMEPGPLRRAGESGSDAVCGVHLRGADHAAERAGRRDAWRLAGGPGTALRAGRAPDFQRAGVGLEERLAYGLNSFRSTIHSRKRSGQVSTGRCFRCIPNPWPPLA